MLKKRIKRVARLISEPFISFFNLQAASGILLLIGTAIAMTLSNTSMEDSYFNFWHEHLTIGYGDFEISKSLLHWVNDGLMALFFFFVGLEIKREVLVGELHDLKGASLPICAALGGMLFPAIIFTMQMGGTEAEHGWGIPMATDIAFSLGILSLLGKRVPLSLKIFLTTLAVVDDLGAILVIAIFYTSHVNFHMLAMAGGLILLLMFFNYLNIKAIVPYGIIGVLLWAFFLQSNIHPTIAGVALAFTFPARRRILTSSFLVRIRAGLEHFERNKQEDSDIVLTNEQITALYSIEDSAQKVQAPLQRMENILHGFVLNFIMPVFALANAAIIIDFTKSANNEINPLSLAVFTSLIFGKVIGISLFSYLGIKLGIASLPSHVKWSNIIGISFLGGVGFTMSLFITNLAYDTHAAFLNPAKIGIIVASTISAILGFIILKKSLPKIQELENNNYNFTEK